MLRSGAPQRWVGLDVTLQVRLTRDHARQMQTATTPFAPFAGEATLGWIDHLAASSSRATPPKRTPAPCTIPSPWRCSPGRSWSSSSEAAVSIGTGDGENRGVMVTDLLESADPPPANCRVAASVDADAFIAHFLGHLRGL